MRNNKKNIGSFDTAIEYPDSNEISSDSVKVVIYTKQHVISYAIYSTFMETVLFNIYTIDFICYKKEARKLEATLETTPKTSMGKRILVASNVEEGHEKIYT